MFCVLYRYVNRFIGQFLYLLVLSVSVAINHSSLMCDRCNRTNVHKREKLLSPFLPQPFCSSANERRQHTIDRLTNIQSRPTATAVDSLKIVGRKLNAVGSEVSLSNAGGTTYCRRLAGFNDEVRPTPCAGKHLHDSAASKFVHSYSTVHLPTPTAYSSKLRCYCDDDDDDSCECRPADNGNQECPTCQQQHDQIPCTELGQKAENQCHCNKTVGDEPAEISQHDTAAKTYSNARLDQNRLLKIIRRFSSVVPVRDGELGARGQLSPPPKFCAVGKCFPCRKIFVQKCKIWR